MSLPAASGTSLRVRWRASCASTRAKVTVLAIVAQELTRILLTKFMAAAKIAFDSRRSNFYLVSVYFTKINSASHRKTVQESFARMEWTPQGLHQEGSHMDTKSHVCR